MGFHDSKSCSIGDHENCMAFSCECDCHNNEGNLTTKKRDTSPKSTIKYN